MSALLTWTASAVWSCLSALARALSAWGFLKKQRLSCRVISVGNIQVGGAGKTPLVAQIAREAAERGQLVVILCRGYGGEWESQGGVIAPGTCAPDVVECGDEAALLHELAPHAWIGVGARRAEQFKKIAANLEKLGKLADLVILDDGFQHWKIHKDLEVVAITSKTRGEVLFRDWSSALRHAGLVVWTKGSEANCVFGVKTRHQLKSALSDRPLWLVTGLADGKSALDAVRAAGYLVENHVSFPDHARYDSKMVTQFCAQARAKSVQVATTGKDWVKWREFGLTGDQVLVLEPDLVFEEGRETWLRALWGG